MATVITAGLFLLVLGNMVRLWCDGQLRSRPLVLGKPVGGSTGLFGLMLGKDLRGLKGIYFRITE